MIPRLKPSLNWREFIKIFLPARKKAVALFENKFSEKMQQKHGVAFPYGRTGLAFLLEAMGLKGKEILCPAYTCVVVAHAIVTSGNTPVFVDSQASDFNMDLELLNEKITDKTGAIIATSIFGYPVDLDKLNEIKSKYPQIKIIQDCAHSFSAEWHGKPVQCAGDAAIYGLNISKMMTSVFGGMVTTDNSELAERLRCLRGQRLLKVGLVRSLKRRLYLAAVFVAFNPVIYAVVNWLERTGFLNYFVKYYDEGVIDMPVDYLSCLTSFEAEIGLVQLKKYDAIVEWRRTAAAYYSSSLKDLAWLSLPVQVDGATYSHYVVLNENRNELLQQALHKGLQLGQLIEYSVPHMKAYKASAGQDENYEISKKFSETSVNLPVWFGVDYKRVVRIVRRLKV